MRRPLILIFLIAGVLAARPAGAVTHTVNVTNNQFTPKNLTITVGDVVLWQWVAGSHTTTSGTAPPGNGLWNANLASSPASARQFSRTFTTTGTFPYFCSPHFSLGMTGSIIVNPPPNTPPVVANPGTQNGVEGVFLSFNVTATDPENNTLVMTGLGLPAGANFVDNGNRSCTISWTPGFTAAGTYPVSVRATDPGGLSDTEPFDIVIAPTEATVINVQGTGSLAHTGHGAHGTQSLLPLSFDPPLVTIDAGDQVAWNWVEGTHTTTSGSSSDPMHNPGALWDVTIDSLNPIYFRTFDDPGVYDYFCRNHEGLGQKARIIVRTTTGIPDDAAMGSARGLRAFPNPFTSAVDLGFRLEDAQVVSVTVYDLGGHRVRQLEAGAFPAGDHVVRWDGQDEAGRGAAAGVYLVRVLAAQGTLVSKVFKTR